MKKTVLAGCLALSLHSFSQNTLFADNFEMPGFNWNLNSSGSGLNEWTINAVYPGNSGQSIPDVPDQPVSFLNGPQSQYLHIHNMPNCDGIVPVTCNANFDPNAASNIYTEMSFDMVTTSETGVSLSFWYLCGGMDNVSYGTVEYSTDGGLTWQAATTPFFGVSTEWTQATITNPAFDGQATLRFRFGWTNGSQGLNPPFSIDEIVVSSTGSQTGETITMQHLNASIYCPGDSDSIGFEALGTYNAGNVFTAQLSDASGSFASPVNIGTLSSSASGIQSINGTFPSSTPAGTGYRVRVIASNPPTTGGDNGEDVVFNPLPVIAVTSVPGDGIICEGSSAVLTADGATTYQWAPAGSLSSDNGTTVTATPTITTIYTITGTQFEGCTNTTTFTVTVEDCADLDEQADAYLKVYPNPASDKIHVLIALSDEVTLIELIDESGRIVHTINWNIHDTGTDLAAIDVHVDHLQKGLYTVRITHAKGRTTTRFTKQ